MLELSVPQPKAAEIYYNTCAMVDGHNRHRQATLMMERKVETKSWEKRVGMTILSMVIVDTWLVYKHATHTDMVQTQFYEELATNLIDNSYDRFGLRARLNLGESISPSLLRDARTGAVRCGVDHHVTPTKRRKRKRNGEITSHALQGHCIVCRKSTKYLCSTCNDVIERGGQGRCPWICNPATGRVCFETHTEQEHT